MQKGATASDREAQTALPARTVVGWQGVRFTLPPEWNVTAFSLDRDNGYVRVDSPGSGAMSVQVRWTDASKEVKGPPTPYYLLAPYFRRLLKRPPPPVTKTDLRQSLEKILKDAAKDAKKSHAVFDSQMKSEKTEGENGERSSISFTWTGAGRGQGKIWRCDTCNRVVVSQVIGLSKDHNAIGNVASQLFATFQDHTIDGYDLWALYDLQAAVPSTFRLTAHKLMSGHLQLVFMRGAERIIIDRWGLANVTLKKFKLDEWFLTNSAIKSANMVRTSTTAFGGHEFISFEGALPVSGRMAAVRDAKGSMRGLPTRYSGGVWHCAETNKLFSIQVFHSRKTEKLIENILERCKCH